MEELDNGYYDDIDSYAGYDANNQYDLVVNSYGDDDDNDGAEDDKDSNAAEKTSINFEPDWRSEGEGFTQTVYIGMNTFWGLILLSLFFGLISCSFVCCFLHFNKLYENGIILFNRDGFNELINVKNMKLNNDDGLDTIDEDENVKFNINKQEQAQYNQESGQEDIQY